MKKSEIDALIDAQPQANSLIVSWGDFDVLKAWDGPDWVKLPKDGFRYRGLPVILGGATKVIGPPVGMTVGAK